MTTHEVLVEARQRLEDPANWCHRGAYGGGANMCAALTIGQIAKDALGQGTDQASALYISGCTAVTTAALGTSDWKGASAVALGRWNDAPKRTHSEVVAAFDKAIAATAPAPDMSWLEEPAAEYLVS